MTPEQRRKAEQSLLLLSLLDVLTRQSIYIEGVKAYEAKQFGSILAELAKDLRATLSSLPVRQLNDLTKFQLNNLLLALKRSQSKILNAYADKLLEFLRKFMEVDTSVTGYSIEQALGEQFSVSYPNPDIQWGIISNAPIPANGIILPKFINAAVLSILVSILNKVSQGYANNNSVNEILDQIVGTAEAKYNDGLFSKAANQIDAAISTATQHVHSIVSNSVQSSIFDYYQWVSVIDGRTTEICLSRSGNIYQYGNGPLPPAHIRCRSSTVPILDPDNPPSVPSFSLWAKSQPANLQEDIRNNVIRKNNGDFQYTKPLSLAEYDAKRSLITERSGATE